jgi:hypothetical protein
MTFTCIAQKPREAPVIIIYFRSYVVTTHNKHTTMMKENGSLDTPSTRTRRIRIALILSFFCLLSLYTVEDESNFLSSMTSDESLSSQNRRQLISDNVWEAELRERQLRVTGGNNNNSNKKQRVQIERKRMLEEDLGRGAPQRYVSAHQTCTCPPAFLFLSHHSYNILQYYR